MHVSLDLYNLINKPCYNVNEVVIMSRGLYDRNQKYWNNAIGNNEKNKEHFEDSYQRHLDDSAKKGKFHISVFARTVFLFLLIVLFIVFGIRYLA